MLTRMRSRVGRMSAPARVAAFGAALGVAFGAAAAAGAVVDPVRAPSDGAAHAHGHGADHGAAHGATGLAIAEDGYRLVPDATGIPAGESVRWTFRIVGPDGAAVTDFDVEHERRMHLIVVRRDLTGYQHLHPSLGAGGRWSVALRLPEAGVYRAYADFTADGRPLTLATDLLVAGAFAPRPLPAPVPVDATEGYSADLHVEGGAAGEDTDLTYELSHGGRPLDHVEPYLGADGHLVALREGDLAFLHLHPEDPDAPGTIRFGATLPSAGRYRLFLQFRHDGRVRTVAHTIEVTG